MRPIFTTLLFDLIETGLLEDFGFRHRLWVYSGRRGVHCWVADEKARALSAECRRAIVHYLELIQGGMSDARKVYLKSHSHPFIR